MPVHWYYNPDDIRKQFGTISGYQGPKDTHPSSIMSFSSTGGHGRGDQRGSVIGDVICHGKRDAWGVPNAHYRRGMSAGQNTLNALCARCALRKARPLAPLLPALRHWDWCQPATT
jgi:ADP-ribosyl-[dinitrogen reductase] hydrolase